MFDTQKSNQFHYPRMDLAPQQEETPVYATVSVNPYASQAHVVALLAWAVRTADEHGILEIVEQTTARLSFLAAVRVAEAFLSQEECPKALVHQESAGPAHEPRTAVPYETATSLPEENRCQFADRRWTLRFAGETVTQRNLKGWRYLTFLLQRPHAEVHVLDLLQLTDAQPGPARAGLAGASADHLAAQGLRAIRGLDERTTIDATSRTAYRQRWGELQGELEEAERFNDLARAAKVRAEVDFLAAELATGYGSRRHSRTVSETAEKARKAVTNRLRDAVANVQYLHPALWQHLSTALKTGAFCSYHPAHPTRWVF